MEFTNLNYIDYLAIATLFISAMLSTVRGMTREFLGLVGWFIAIFIAKLASPVLAPLLESFISISSIISPISLILPFFASFVVWYVFASVVSPSLSRAGLGALDGGMGVFFGLARGIVIVVLCYLVLIFFSGGEKEIPKTVRESNTAHFSLIIINLTKPLLPDSIQNQFDILSIPEIETNNYDNLAPLEKSLADTPTQKSSMIELYNTDKFQASKNPVAVTLQERPVD